MATAYRAASIVDGVSEQGIQDGTVVVDDGRITWVGTAREAPTPAEVIELGAVTLLPGLIDAHVHLVWSATAEPHELVSRESAALTVLRASTNAARHLRAGVTTIRDLGSTDGLAIEELAIAHEGRERQR